MVKSSAIYALGLLSLAALVIYLKKGHIQTMEWTRDKNYMKADCGCGCNGEECPDEKKKAENSTTTYTERYDPVNDFMPRYRWPEDTVWGPNYDPVDPFRPADYQRVQVVRDEGSVTKGAF